MSSSSSIDPYVSIFGTMTVLILIFILIIYTYYKLNKDYAEYKMNLNNAISSSSSAAPLPGATGAAGKDAYHLYLESLIVGPTGPFIFGTTGPDDTLDGITGDYFVDENSQTWYGPKTMIWPPTGTYITGSLTFSAWEAAFTGEDAPPGIDAPIPIDGARGDDGSQGDHGDHGVGGSKGAAGLNGVTGIEGDTFVSFPLDNLDPILPVGNDSPAGYPSCEFSGPTGALPNYAINYFFKGKRLFDADIGPTGSVNTGSAIAYVSLLVYDKDLRIIGLTSPIKFKYYFHTNDIYCNIIKHTTEDLYFRSFISHNKALVMSSFTANIIESALEDDAFTYTRPNETDPFIKKFYDIISTNDNLSRASISPYVFSEKVKISAATQVTLLTSTPLDLINLT
jgi:hypothetical protein